MKVERKIVLEEIKKRESEWICELRKGRGQSCPERGEHIALALSGGGVRAASFSFGVLAALNVAGVLNRIDILSTVSGGGFIGSAMTWFAHRYQSFVAAKAVLHGRQPNSAPRINWLPFLGARSSGQRLDPEWTDPHHFIRLHGDYLQPTAALSAFSNMAVIVRSLAVALLGYAGMFASCLILLMLVGAWIYPVFGSSGPHAVVSDFFCTWHGPECVVVDLPEKGKDPLWIALFGTFILSALLWALFLIVSAGYSLVSSWMARKELDAGRYGPPELAKEASTRFYCVRRNVQLWLSLLLAIAVASSIAAFILMVGVGVLSPRAEELANRTQIGAWLDTVFPGWILSLSALAASAIAATGLALEYVKTAADDFLAGSKLKQLRVTVWCSLLLLGMAVLAAAAAVVAVGPLLESLTNWKSPKFYVPVVLFCLAMLVAWLTNVNHSGLHRLYRDRLMEAFLPSERAYRDQAWTPAEHANSTSLCALGLRHGSAPGPDAVLQPQSPLHILNSNVVLVDSANPSYRGRGGDSFVMTPLFCGAESVGWRPSYEHPYRTLTLATAMAASGAAINPRTAPAGEGATRGAIVSWLLALTNLRLGFWLPTVKRATSGAFGVGVFGAGFRTFFRRTAHELAEGPFEITDGGHFDNTGLYELFRRRVMVIVLVDAGQDPHSRFGDIANALERARLDFGVHVRFLGSHSLGHMVPRTSEPMDRSALTKETAERGFAVARVEYPEPGLNDGDQEKSYQPEDSGVLIVLKPTIIAGLPVELQSFAEIHQDFPQHSTADQFFDESKFDAYRELGYRITKAAMLDCLDPQGPTRGRLRSEFSFADARERLTDRESSISQRD